MKVLFFMRSTLYVRNFESTLRLLAERGHEVHVAADVHQVLDPKDLMGRLCREHSRITHSLPPAPSALRWRQLGVELRKSVDYLRYLDPEYRNAPKLRLRAELLEPVLLGSRPARRLAARPGGRQLLRRAFGVMDRAVPPDPSIQAFIRHHRPDLVLVTPLVEPGSPQSEYLRAARALGIPTGLCVYSWDNLTSKGLIHDPVDVVTVWNDAMKDEAVALHHVPSERVVVTGAAAYDHWFGWTSRTLRDAFCARVGLDAARPYLLYLCSSKFIAPYEGPFVRRWIEAIRSASPILRGFGVLVRPHPQNVERWRDDAEFADLDNVAIWPRSDGNPADDESRADYYDSIAFSAAVIGINTSALIESAIVGRGVFTVLAPEFRDTQDGTLHFRHLREVNGGLLHVASEMMEHAAQLEAAVQNPEAAANRCRRFVEAFVRPHAIDEPATPRLVSALEATAANGTRRPRHAPSWAGLARPALAAVAARVERALERQAEAEAQRAREKRLDQEQRAARERARAEEAAFAAKSASRAFTHFLNVRDAVRRLQTAAPADGVTPAERRILAALEPLWDAGPDSIAALRQRASAVSDIRPVDYAETANRSLKYRFERDVRRLLFRGDSTLWVDEPPVLGAFGFTSNGRRYNEDTLRFFRVVSLLQDAALMSEFRGARRTVWEIGGGWGGFAYHFKTVCPDVTYLITGRPELFLLSAVYLMTLFPEARCRFYDPTDPAAFWHNWDAVDFAFAPECAVAAMQPPSLALTLDLMALERMTDPRVCLHVRRAYDLGSRFFASICPAGTPDPNIAAAVEPALQRFYWRHPVSTPESLARRLSLSPGEEPVERTYFLGWKRLRA